MYSISSALSHRRLFLFAITLVSIVWLTGCASTQRVNTFSQTCLESLDAADKLEFSFANYCWNKTFYSKKIQLEMADIDGTPVAKIKMLDECLQDAAIDSQANVIKTTLYAYFDGLHRLSADNVVQYNVEPVTRNFTTRKFPNWQVDEATVSAANKISNLLLKAIAGGYRNEKIKLYITQSDAALGTLVEKLQAYYQLLSTQVTLNSSNIALFYAPFQSDASPYLQSQALKEMSGELNRMEAKAAELNALQALLGKIRSGHNAMVTASNTMSFKEWQQFISKQSSEVFAAAKSLHYLYQKNNGYAAPKL